MRKICNILYISDHWKSEVIGEKFGKMIKSGKSHLQCTKNHMAADFDLKTGE